MKSVLFEWDSKKNRTNVRKHRISFIEAQTVFEDESAVEFYDRGHSTEEDRFLLLGISRRLQLLLVCYTVTETSRHTRVRIISARKATKNESLHYTRRKP